MSKINTIHNKSIHHKNRIGFHYIPDTLHYRDSDLRRWLPELQELGASWLTLMASPTRAIPEFFIRDLVDAEIEPIVHIHTAVSLPLAHPELNPILEAYANWGVQYVCLFDRPNVRQSWGDSSWAQNDLVERFLDIYLPLAETSLQFGLKPVFPPLEPGGDYWDTAFLRTALAAIHRRGHHQLISKLTLGVYAWADEHPLDWGAGGPERWPGARPYFTPPGEQDQRGFRIFDWYMILSHATLGKSLPIILMGAGDRRHQKIDKNLSIALLMEGDIEGNTESVPSEVLTCNFWLLSAPPDSDHADEGWYQLNGKALPTAKALKKYMADRDSRRDNGKIMRGFNENSIDKFEHYLLIPSYEWGVADWHLDIIKPFIKKHKPIMGFSVEEAKHARRVTVLGGKENFSEETLTELRSAGCIVQRIDGDGTAIATRLASA